jgi:hypothetical protein
MASLENTSSCPINECTVPSIYCVRYCKKGQESGLKKFEKTGKFELKKNSASDTA